VIEKNCRWCGAKTIAGDQEQSVLCERCVTSRQKKRGSSTEPEEVISEGMIDKCCSVLGMTRGEFWHYKLLAFRTVVVDAAVEWYRHGDPLGLEALRATITELLAAEAQAREDLQKHRRQ
jgi:hypothetical protein